MSENTLEQFKFSGNAKEWFGIWIINLLLSIVTLGVYSAWAKVRKKKYFANHTYISGRNFDYHATGQQILISRLIVIGGATLFIITLNAAPILGLILMIGLIYAIPWLIVRSMMFNARMTSFSNVRFNFISTVREAFLIFVIYPFLTALTAFTTAPFLTRAIQKYIINKHRLGTAKFQFDSSILPFYRALLIAVVWFVVVAILGAFFILILVGAIMGLGDDSTNVVRSAIQLINFVAFLSAGVIYFAMIRNTIYNAMTLTGGHRFNSTVSAGKFLWLTLSNFVVVLCSLGLMIPWAQVRMSKYLAKNTTLILGDSLDVFIGTQQSGVSALGDAFTDLENVDVGLSI